MATILGIDPSTKKLAAIVTRDGNLLGVKCIDLPVKDRGNTRAAKAYNDVQRLIRTLQPTSAGQVYVFLESPIYWRGSRSTLPLAQISGAVQASVCNSQASLTMVNPSHWKKVIIGKGNAQKPDIAMHIEAVWPDAYDAAQGDQDLIDAAGIALYGMKVMNNRVRIKQKIRSR